MGNYTEIKARPAAREAELATTPCSERLLKHGYVGEWRDGKLMRTDQTALCGYNGPMPDELDPDPDAKVCPICHALWKYGDYPKGT